MKSKWLEILSQKKEKVINAVIILILIITGLSLGALAGFYSHLEYQKYKEGQAFKRAIEGYLKLYREDVIGGNTPEETIDMFIEALKKGDYELARKYFVVEEQERRRESFRASNRKYVEEWIDELEDAKTRWEKEQKSSDRVIFSYNTGTDEEEITNLVRLTKNINNKWKIEGF